MTSWQKCFQHHWHLTRGIHQSLVDSPHKEPVMQCFHFFFVVSMSKQLNKQTCQWFYVPYNSHVTSLSWIIYHLKPLDSQELCLLMIFASRKLEPPWITVHERLRYEYANVQWWNGFIHVPDSKVHVDNMGPTWVLPAPDGPHVGLRGYKLTADSSYLCQ